MADSNSVTTALATLTSSGWVARSLVSTQDGAALPIAGKHISALVRPFVGRSNDPTSGATNYPHTWTWALNLPVPWYAARLRFQLWGTAAGTANLAGFAALIGASDDIGNCDYTDITAPAFKKAVTPRAGGGEYATTVSDGSFGWKAVTWSGSGTLSLSDPGQAAVAYGVSDIVYERSRYDTANAGYPILVRMYGGSGGMCYAGAPAGAVVGANWKTDVVGGQQAVTLKTNTDAVTTPANWVNATTGHAAATFVPNVVLEVFTASGVMTVHNIGDSRWATSAESSATKAYLSAETYLQNALRAAGKKAVLFRGAWSNSKSTVRGGANTNYNDGNLALAQACPPQWFVYQLYTSNDGTLTEGMATKCIQEALQFLNSRSPGSRVCFVLGFPKSSAWSATSLSAMQALREFAAAYGDTYVDTMALFGDASGVWSVSTVDGTHMFDAESKTLADAVAAAIVAVS